MSNFGKKISLFILICLIAFILCLLSYNKSFLIKSFENTKSLGISALQKFSFNAAYNIKAAAYNIFFFRKIARENESLKRENILLKNKLLTLEMYIVENTELKKMLAITDNAAGAKVASQVIGRPPDGWFDIIYIDKGSKYNIKKNDIVISSEGLVGRVLESFKPCSRVLILTNPKFSAVCKLPKSGQTGILYGTGAKFCIMKYVDSRAKTDIGDLVLTSGLSSKYPENIPVGKVKRVTGSDDGMYKELTIEPAVDFGKLRFVWVIGK